MNRVQEYLTYHNKSQEIGDIDPSYAMLKYVCDRFELNLEQRYWLAFVYSLTYAGASTFFVYNEFPDFENLDSGRLNRWWSNGGRDKTICQTDRRWVKSNNLFVPAVEAYRKWIGEQSQHDHFTSIATGNTPEERYDKLYRAANHLPSFGQFALFLYLEALHTITPLDLAPTNLNLIEAWSCRNGLFYAYGYDHWITEKGDPLPFDCINSMNDSWKEVREKLQPASTVWQIETTLCAYRKFYRGKRYIGYYLDRQALEIAKMAQNVKYGVCWGVLWQYRQETYNPEFLVEQNTNRNIALGLPTAWVDSQAFRTTEILKENNVS